MTLLLVCWTAKHDVQFRFHEGGGFMRRVQVQLQFKSNHDGKEPNNAFWTKYFTVSQFAMLRMQPQN
jgi:hypothetical protein